MTALLRGTIMPASLEASGEVRACANVVMFRVSVMHRQKIKLRSDADLPSNFQCPYASAGHPVARECNFAHA
jgi:hypothetical protein